MGGVDNTIIVFSSDHGDLCGEHTRVNKGVSYEASGRIPFVLAGEPRNYMLEHNDKNDLAAAKLLDILEPRAVTNATDFWSTSSAALEIGIC